MIEIIPNWHPIFVHFTVALLSVAALLKLGTFFIGSDALRDQWRLVARWNLWIGTGFVVLTVLTGVIAYNSVSHDTPSHAAMTDHRNWALVTSILFLALAAWSVLLFRAGTVWGGLFVAALLVATAMLGTTAWKGGEVVYRYGLGVMSLPKADSHGHTDGAEHGHGPATESAHDNADGHHEETMTDHHDGEAGKGDDHHDNADGHHDEKKPDSHNNNDGHHDKKVVDSHDKPKHDNSDGHHDNGAAH